MAKSKGRLLAELLSSDGKVKESKSALDISGGKLGINDIAQILLFLLKMLIDRKLHSFSFLP